MEGYVEGYVHIWAYSFGIFTQACGGLLLECNWDMPSFVSGLSRKVRIAMKNRKHIAVIEKNHEMRIMLEQLLGCLGHEAAGYDSPFAFPCCTDGSCTSDRKCFDALIINCNNNTELDGMDFIKCQKEKNCKILKMAVMSGSWNHEGLKKSRVLKCKLLSKPFSMEELEEWIES